MNDGGWSSDDPFVDPDDPAAIERDKRRREREERRRQRRQREQPTEAQHGAHSSPHEERGTRNEERAGAEGTPTPRSTPAASAPFANRVAEMRKRLAGSRPARRARPSRRAGTGGAAGAGGPGGKGASGGAKAPGGGELVAALSANRRPIAALVATALVLLFLIVLLQPFHGEGSGKALVQIPKGASVGEVADILDDRGVVSSSTLFQMRVTLAGKRSELYPGNFTLANGMSYGDAIDALSTPPEKRTITVVIPEGLSRSQIAPIAKGAGIDGGYMKASERSKFINPARYGARGAKNLEGFLFPATYELPARGTATDLVQLQVQAFQQRIREVNMKYARSKNLTTYDVLIIASMIEREVQVPRERKLVAAVIYNRLREGQPLGIDATTRFAVGNYTQPLTNSQLATPSPYNTRTNAGLPPGPIGNPGIAAIQAAAHPAQVNYRFYVVKPGTCGQHSFSANEAKFLRDQAAYQRALEEKGGSPTEC
ncbi:MAG: endolytic transglycosylase MltG [Actinomycetota bacterium]